MSVRLAADGTYRGSPPIVFDIMYRLILENVELVVFIKIIFTMFKLFLFQFKYRYL